MKKIYLDYAAATPLLPEVGEAMQPFASSRFYNPSSIYLAARDVRLAIDQARANVARILGAKPGEIIFCSGTTEANNLAIGGVARAHPTGRIALAATEHQVVLQAAKGYAQDRVDIIKVQPNGQINLEFLEKVIKPTTVLISVGYANSETGVVQPLAKLAKFVTSTRQRRAKNSTLPLYFHTDASGAANYLPLKVSRLGVDLLSLGGGKIYGPKSSGILFSKNGVRLEPLHYGGGQERGLRAGTEDAGAIVGFAKALSVVQTSAQSETQRLRELRDELFSKLSKRLPELNRHGSPDHSLPNILSLSLAVTDGERLVMELDEAGIMAATGAACSANTDEASHVLLAMGLTLSQATASLRLSLGRATTRSDVRQAARRIIAVVSRLP